jgi:tripeptide aminopeptidase
MDTVAPGRDVRPALVKDRIVAESDTVLGADDKSAIAVYIQALRIAKEHRIPLRPLEFVFTDGEEMGLVGAKRLVPGLVTAREGLCFDTSGRPGSVYIAAPTYDRYEIEVFGRAAHSGIEPEKGLNAIRIMAEIVGRIPGGRIDADTTANIGTVRGGRQNNIVPDQCVITGEVRSLTRSKTARFLSRIRSTARAIVRKRGGRMKFSATREFEGFSFRESDPFLRSVTAGMRACRLPVSLMTSNGGSDANIFNAAGVRTLNCGIGMQNVHTKKEFIRVRDLADTLRFLVRFISLNGTEVSCE